MKEREREGLRLRPSGQKVEKGSGEEERTETADRPRRAVRGSSFLPSLSSGGRIEDGVANFSPTFQTLLTSVKPRSRSLSLRNGSRGGGARNIEGQRPRPRR